MNIDNLKRKFKGRLILPQDETYDSVRNVFMGKGSPALVVRPLSAHDVALAIDFARQESLEISVRSGGHHGAAFGTNDDGLVIDLSELNRVELVDREQCVVRVGAGAIWKQVAVELQKFDLALTAGDTTSVGVGGLTLGGGIGWMVRQHGLTIDCLQAAEIVTADGRVLRASTDENPDLFWAIRGGGGNFGVVTSFEFKAHRLKNVYAGSIMYPLDNLKELLTRWRDVMRDANRDLTTSFTIMPGFGGAPPSAMVLCCYAGDNEVAAKAALEPLQKLGKPIAVDIKKKTYADVLEEAHPPGGMKAVVKSIFAHELSDAMIKAIDASTRQDGSRVLQIRYLRGAVSEVPAMATAFAHRDSEIMMFCGAFVAPTATAEEEAAALKPWTPIESMGSGAYANFISTNTEKDVRAVYPPDTYDKLARLKAVYDPENIFHHNFNIKPHA